MCLRVNIRDGELILPNNAKDLRGAGMQDLVVLFLGILKVSLKELLSFLQWDRFLCFLNNLKEISFLR